MGLGLETISILLKSTLNLLNSSFTLFNLKSSVSSYDKCCKSQPPHIPKYGHIGLTLLLLTISILSKE